MLNIINRKSELKLKRDFLKEDYSKLYLLGVNYSFQMNNTIKGLLKQGITITGIIDDFYKESTYQGYQVYKMDEVEQSAVVISMVTATKMWRVLLNLEHLGFKKVYTYWDLCLVDEENYPLPYHCTNNIRDIEENKDKYLKLYDLLEDKESKEILSRVLDFRYNLFVEPMKYFLENIKSKQYFDEIINGLDLEVFVDCGGFDGMTTIDFIEMNGDYKKIYYFEPSEMNMSVSKDSLSSYINIEFLEKGTFSENKQLKFAGSKGSSASFSESGEDIVNVVKLDDMIRGDKIFIKMDIEGAEYDSLVGAEMLIKEKKPALAICVYHDQEHFWKIPQLVKQMRSDYKVYLRHYSEGNLETVMYFV